MSVIDEARRLSRLGFNTLPTRRGKKTPGLSSWKQYQSQRTDDKIEAWFGPGSGYVGIWVPCGKISGLLVLDCDSPLAEEWWQDYLGDVLSTTTCVKTSKGKHYWFKLPLGEEVQSWAVKEDGLKFDVQAEGKGVMAPPSPHPDGGYYKWVREPEDIQQVPEILMDGGVAWRATWQGGQRLPGSLGGAGGSAITRAPTATPPREPRSLLSQLIANPPEEGGRNDWLTQVAGHEAKFANGLEDLYRQRVALANEQLAEPLDDEEVEKVTNSVWKAEQAKGLDLKEITDETGWLIGNGHQLFSPCRIDDKQSIEQWADFDIEVLGRLVGEESVDYLVALQSPDRRLECRLDGKVLGSGRDLTVWLAERQCSIIPSRGDLFARVAESKRLLRYGRSQDAPTYKTAPHLGWNDDVGGYIVHEGTITASAELAEPFTDTRPDPILLDWAPYRYGFRGTRDDARHVLAEILTFHDETVTAVYGSWWAACFLKTQIMAKTSLFPFMALEAPSESGKTTGFFSLMVQLGGNYEGHGEFTMAALRDRVSGHRNGAVWIDDISDPEGVWDLVRQSTSEGSRTKKQGDRYHQERVSLVAPIVVSAEGMESLNTEKALADRAVKLSVPSPTSRVSTKNPDRPQWDDILDLQAQYNGDLTQIAGWFVSMALECVPMVSKMRELRVESGRHGDKLGILRLGARILAKLSGNQSVVERVDAWCGSQIYVKGDNLLTTKILPWAWAQFGFPHTPQNGVIVYLKDERTICYREAALADVWSGRRDLTQRERQLGSLSSIREQRRDLGMEGNGHSTRTTMQNMRYQHLPDHMSELVIERAGIHQHDPTM